ncbi:5'-nucleotidase [Prolixibacteraceae bacterium JC049]|nr:5'-nucleotidase [Prolixibacteraceae bacterium JC049]
MSAYPIDRKLVIGIASSALFDLSESDKIYQEKGIVEYRKFQESHLDTVLKKGVAFPFIRRFLSLNNAFPEQQPVEVVLLSKNSPETGLRVFNSIKHYGLDITRAAFFSGKSPFKYIDAFNASLFLSANSDDVRNAIDVGFPAGQVIETEIEDDEQDLELRLAFDFDGVIIDDEAEEVYKTTGDLDEFNKNETEKVRKPHNPGPLSDLFQKIAFFQKLEEKKSQLDPNYKPILKTSIVTARSAPAHERMINTLKKWEINVDEAFFLGGIEKARFLKVLKPHMYFDDQTVHLKKINNIPMVHIPFGISNNMPIKS